jgi:hypothetical protein
VGNITILDSPHAKCSLGCGKLPQPEYCQPASFFIDQHSCGHHLPG